jgi:hypothetical protein
MQQQLVNDEGKFVASKENKDKVKIQGKNDHGLRKELIFFLKPEDYELVARFFKVKDNSEPDDQLLVKMVREFGKV